MSRFFSHKYDALTPYTPGEQPKDGRYIKLNTNESPYETSPRSAEYAAKEALNLRLYSDPDCTGLVRCAAAYFGVEEEEILFFNGSDETLNFAVMAFCDEKTGAVFPDITYGFYPVICALHGIAYEEIPLEEDLSIRTEAYYNIGKTIFLANPNAPTGIALSRGEIETVIQKNPDSIVVVDEAYVDFGAESCVPLIHQYDNLLVVQTMSKSRSLAGGRLGFAIGNKELIRDLNTLKYSFHPYNVNRMTMAAGIGAFEDDAYIKENCRKICEVREFAAKGLKELGFSLTDSKSNFLFASHPEISGGDLYQKLKERGILVRYFNKMRLTGYVRITVGTKEQMETLLKEIRLILKEEL